MAAEGGDIVRPRDAAAGNNREPARGGEAGSRFDIDALEHSVASDVGEQQRRDPGIFEAAGEVGDGDGRHACPAPRRNHAVARVDGDDDSPRGGGGSSADEIGVVKRRRPHDDARDAKAQPAVDVGAGADAAADLHRAGEGGDDCLDRP